MLVFICYVSTIYILKCIKRLTFDGVGLDDLGIGDIVLLCKPLGVNNLTTGTDPLGPVQFKFISYYYYVLIIIY